MRKFLALLTTAALVCGMIAGTVITAYAAESDEEIPEIYTLISETSLAGLKSPYIPDRSDIDKAWPKEPKDKDHIKRLVAEFDPVLQSEQFDTFISQQDTPLSCEIYFL